MYVPNTSINITALISFCLYIHTTVHIEVTAPSHRNLQHLPGSARQ